MPKSTPPRKKKGQQKAIPETNPWDDLKLLHERALSMMAEASKAAIFYRDPTALRMVKDRSRFNTLGNILLNDMKQFTTRLEAIKGKHVNARPPKDEAEMVLLAISIGEQYNHWIADFAGVVPQTVSEILAMASGKTTQEIAEEKEKIMAGSGQAFAGTDAYVPPKDPHAQKVSDIANTAVTEKPKVDLMALAKGKRGKK